RPCARSPPRRSSAAGRRSARGRRGRGPDWSRLPPGDRSRAIGLGSLPGAAVPAPRRGALPSDLMTARDLASSPTAAPPPGRIEADRARLRSHRAALAGLALVLAAMFPGALAGQVFFFMDFHQTFEPLAHVLAAGLRGQGSLLFEPGIGN